MTTTSVLFLGATGFVGGPIAQRVLNKGFKVTALVRSDDSRAANLRKAGAKVILGTLDSVEEIEKHSQSSHAVFACAANSHLPSIRAVLRGFKTRREQTGEVGILIHTSGTGIFTTGDARGLPPSSTDKVYSDLDIASIESLGSIHPQRKVHLEIIVAAEQGNVKSYIVLPSTIFGISSEEGAGEIFKKHSNQMPALIRASIKRKQAGKVGAYENTWPLVHTDDLTDLYLRVFSAALEGQDAGQGREGFYVAENGQYVGLEAARKIGEALVARGLSQAAEPTSFSEDELKVYYGLYANFAGTSSQANGDRSRQLGWSPKHDHASFMRSLDNEVETIWREEF